MINIDSNGKLVNAYLVKSAIIGTQLYSAHILQCSLYSTIKSSLVTGLNSGLALSVLGFLPLHSLEG